MSSINIIREFEKQELERKKAEKRVNFRVNKPLIMIKPTPEQLQKSLAEQQDQKTLQENQNSQAEEKLVAGKNGGKDVVSTAHSADQTSGSPLVIQPNFNIQIEKVNQENVRSLKSNSGFYRDSSGVIHCESLKLNSITARFETPFYLVSSDILSMNIQMQNRKIQKLPNSSIAYQVSSFDNPNILSMMTQQGVLMYASRPEDVRPDAATVYLDCPVLDPNELTQFQSGQVTLVLDGLNQDLPDFLSEFQEINIFCSGRRLLTDVLVKIGLDTPRDSVRQLISGLLNRSQFISVKGVCIDFEDEDPAQEEVKDLLSTVVEVFRELKILLTQVIFKGERFNSQDLAASALELTDLPKQLRFVFVLNQILLKGSAALATKVITEKTHKRRKYLVVDTCSASLQNLTGNLV